MVAYQIKPYYTSTWFTFSVFYRQLANPENSHQSSLSLLQLKCLSCFLPAFRLVENTKGNGTLPTSGTSRSWTCFCHQIFFPIDDLDFELVLKWKTFEMDDFLFMLQYDHNVHEEELLRTPSHGRNLHSSLPYSSYERFHIFCIQRCVWGGILFQNRSYLCLLLQFKYYSGVAVFNYRESMYLINEIWIIVHMIILM